MAKYISLIELCLELVDRKQCVQFLFDEGLLRTKMKCPQCNYPLTPAMRRSKLYPIFTCRRGHPEFSQTVAKGTWFEYCKLNPLQVICLVHSFAHKFTYNQTIVVCTIGDKSPSRNAISDWFTYCREVCLLSMEDKYANRGRIGGPGHVVEIDEYKIGRRKLNRGRIVQGNWILGMIDVQTKEVRMSICPNNRRDAFTLYELIEKHVELGSTIHTDCWRGYNGLMGDDFAAHLTVNHSLNSVDTIKNTHMTNMESCWRSLRRKLSKNARCDQWDIHIAEYLWHLDCKNRNVDPFQEIIEDIRLAFPVE